MALFSVDQVQGIMSSLVGHEIDLSALINDNGWIEVDLLWGDGFYIECENWNAEYTGSNTWNVYTDVYSINTSGDGSYKIAEMIYTVIENPDSIFDGYSITGVEATQPKMSEWAKAYYDYLAGGNLERDFYYGAEDYSFYICYIDEDDIPELYVNTGMLTGYALYTYYDGNVVQLISSNGTNYIDWIEKSGRVLYAQGGSAMFGESVWIYEMVDGELQQIAEGNLITQDYIDWYEGDLPSSTWNGRDVTEDEYQALKKEVFDTSEDVIITYDESETLYSMLNKLASFE